MSSTWIKALAATAALGTSAVLFSTPAHAEVFKELEYRGNAAHLVLSALADFEGANVGLLPDNNSKFLSGPRRPPSPPVGVRAPSSTPCGPASKAASPCA
jgi:hypothetical protein